MSSLILIFTCSQTVAGGVLLDLTKGAAFHLYLSFHLKTTRTYMHVVWFGHHMNMSLYLSCRLKDVPRYLKDLFTNWSFIFLTLFVCCDMAILSGFTVFGPKYVEVQFSLTAGEAGVLFGKFAFSLWFLLPADKGIGLQSGTFGV